MPQPKKAAPAHRSETRHGSTAQVAVPEAQTPGQKILAREKDHAASGTLSEADKVIRGQH